MTERTQCYVVTKLWMNPIIVHQVFFILISLSLHFFLPSSHLHSVPLLFPFFLLGYISSSYMCVWGGGGSKETRRINKQTLQNHRRLCTDCLAQIDSALVYLSMSLR